MILGAMTSPAIPSTRDRTEALSAVTFAAVGVGLGLLLVGAKEWLYGIQGGVSDLTGFLPFGYAYAAGMVAAANPCGILLMPSLVAYYLGSDDAPASGWGPRVAKGFVLGAAATLGFVVLFTGVGLVFASGGAALGAYFPKAGLGVGVALVVLGLWMVGTGRSLGFAPASRAMGAVRLGSDLRSLFAFGIAYGVASLACTLPVFLVVVGAAVGVGRFTEAMGQFVSYALGMGTMLTAVTVGTAVLRGFVVRFLRVIAPFVPRFSAAFLLGAGIFIVHYWLVGGALSG